MRIVWLLWLAFFSSQLLGANSQAQKGVMDLRSISLQDVPFVKLEGEWQFYWNQLLDPATIDASNDFSFQDSPRDWTLYQVNGAKLRWAGAATLRLKVLLPKTSDAITLRVLPMVMAGRVYVNGTLVHEAGVVGTERETPGHRFLQQLVDIRPAGPELDIIVQVSNHMITRSGYAALELGLRPNMLKSEIGYYTHTLFLLGGIFLMAIYHICLFLLRRKDLSNLYFAGVCIANGIFIYAASGAAALYFPSMTSEDAWDLFFAGWYAGGAFFAWFAYSLFPGQFNRRYAYLATAVSGVTMLIMLLTPTDRFIHLPKTHQLGNALLYIYTCVVCVRAIKARLSGPVIYMLATTIYFGSMVNDMLVTKGIVRGELLSSTGLFVFLFFQSILLSRRFSAAFLQVEKAEAEIRGLNESLERKVQQKTQEIRAILTHIRQGIFTLRMNPKGDIVMSEDYSLHLEEMLETRDLNAARLNEVLLEKSDLTSDQKSMIRSTLTAAIGDNEVSFMANKDNLAREMHLRIKPGAPEKILELDWESMLGPTGLVEQILVSMRDVTGLRQLQQQSIDQQKELEYISEIVNTTPDQFAKFIGMSIGFVEENERLIKSNQRKNIEILKILFINMHTIKGTARTYYFHKMTGILHDVEQHYADLIRHEAAIWDQSKLLRDLREARNVLELYDQINSQKLGRKRDRNLIEVNRRVVEAKVNSLNLIDTKPMDPETRAIIEDTRRTFNEVFYSRSIDVLQDILSGSERVARDLGKEIPIVQINDPGIAISQEAQELFHQVFHHLVRNSLDHGIETAADRLLAHKKPTGTLLLDLSEKPEGYLELVYRDDGRGLNLQRLEELGYAKGVLIKGREYTTTRIAELIFENGLSTSNRLTEISGRGVGMDAVRQYLERMGGSIQVVLEPPPRGGFCHFAFHIRIPKGLYTLSLNQDCAPPAAI